MKTSRHARSINGKLKAVRLDYDVARLRRKYAKEFAVPAARGGLQDFNSESGDPFTEKPSLILWCGADLEQDNSGLLQALSRVAPTSVVYRRNGQYGLEPTPSHLNRSTLHGLHARNHAHLLESTRELATLPGSKLLIGHFWGQQVSAGTLQAVRGQGFSVINLALDDRLPDHWTTIAGEPVGAFGVAASVDLTLTTAHDCLRRYQHFGYPARAWWMASDPDLFWHPVEKPRPVDVAFVGSKYGFRQRLIEALTSNGVEVQTFGPGWPTGKITAAETASIFGASKIVLGSGYVGYSRRTATMKLRDFDGPLSGAAYVTSAAPEVRQILQSGREFIHYSNVREAVHAVQYLLDNPPYRKSVAAAGQSRIMAQHTWQHRMEQLFGFNSPE